MNSNPTDDIELSLKNKGYDTIIGVDEVGRGSGALPVVAAA
jgi:ribonuclease HIII